MTQLKTILGGAFEDLKARRLVPVALLLVAAVLAVPVFLLKPAPAVKPAPTASTAAGETVGGLPGPEAALQGEKPLVSLAVLDQPSDLDEFDTKNPFKPIDQVGSGGATDTGSSGPALGDIAPGDTPSTGGTGIGEPTTGGGGGGGGGTPGTGGGQPQTTPAPRTDSPKNNSQPKTETRLTYALDMTIRGPKGLRSYRGLPKLAVLPAQDNPLLVFLGVEDAGTKAVFLVDVKMKSVEGEGTCTPSPTQCATLSLAPGEEHTLANEAGDTWTIRIVEVREVSVAKAAASARAASKRRARRATTSVGQPAPRFVPPIITDLFTGGRS